MASRQLLVREPRAAPPAKTIPAPPREADEGYTWVDGPRELNVFIFFHQATGHIWVEEHRKKVLSGNVRARLRGQRLGRMPKTIDFDEEQQILKWRAPGKDQVGWETVANRLNAIRVPVPMTDKKAERAKKISASALKRWWNARAKTDQNTETDGPESISDDTQAADRTAIMAELTA